VPKVVSARPVTASRAACAPTSEKAPVAMPKTGQCPSGFMWELRDGIDPATATDGPLAPRVVAAKDGDRARQAVRCSKKEPRRSGAEAKDEARVKLHSVAILVGPVADERYGGFVDEGPQTHCKRRPRPCKLPVTFEGAYQPMRDWDANTAARVHHRTCRCGSWMATPGARAAV
jgi:hypothetical protein